MSTTVEVTVAATDTKETVRDRFLADTPQAQVLDVVLDLTKLSAVVTYDLKATPSTRKKGVMIGMGQKDAYVGDQAQEK